MRRTSVARVRRFFACVLCLVLLCLHVLSIPAGAEASDVPDLSRANAVYLYQLENNCVLAEKNIDRVLFPASTVKIMTGLLAVEALEGRMNDTVTVTQAMVDAASGFRMYLTPGEIVTVEQMLYAGLCAGYNDACVVLAYLTAGSVEAFVSQMNVRAAALGMTETVYTNPTGMHDGRMVTTAADTAKLALAAMEHKTYMEIVSTVKYTMSANNTAPARTFYNRNAMIARNVTSRYYNTYANGMSAGTTTEGGYCVVATAEDEDSGLRYLCIVMGADEDAAELGGTVYSYQIANDLLDYAIEDFGMVTILDTETVLARISVGLTERQTALPLVAQRSVTAYLPTDLDPAHDLIYRVMTVEETVNAPVAAGDVLGFVTVSHGDTLLATVHLCASEDVAQNAFLAGLDRISGYTASRRFLLSCGYAAILMLGYFVGVPMWRKRRNRKRAKYF